ncbi:MAG: VOC family protein [Thiogranum sp.]
MEFHHIGIACTDIEKETRYHALLGYSAESSDFIDQAQGVRGRFLTGGGPRLELLSPLDGSNTLAPWIEAGTRMYHQAYTTCDIDRKVEELQSQRARLMVAPIPAVAFGGRRICFLMLPTMSLIELIQAE